MKCANCGNSDSRTLFDEGETIYCNKCCHRTRTDNGKDDLVICQICGKLRDRRAMNCMWCNLSDDISPKLTKKEYDDIVKLNADFVRDLTPNDIRYWRIRNTTIDLTPLYLDMNDNKF